MAFVLASSFSKASSITVGGSWWRSKQHSKDYYATSSGETTLSYKSRKIQNEYCVMRSSQHNLKHHFKVTERVSKSQEFEKKYIVNAAPKEALEYVPEPKESKNILVSVKQSLNVLFRFCRAYVIFDAVFGATFLTLLPVEKISDLSPTFFIGVLPVVIVSICMSIFNAGLNQLFDVEIDKINKPYLPLASGELSFRNGVIIVSSSLILGFLFAWASGSWPLFWTNLISAVLAVAYSADVPLLRWKKYPVLTSLNFIIDGALARPIGYFLHMQTCVLKRPAMFPRQLIFCIAIKSVLSTAIALLKDIPDIEGDEKFGIRSLSSTLGRKQVFWFCISLLEIAYGVTIFMGTTSAFHWSKFSMGVAHAILASALWFRAKSVDVNDSASLQSFYTDFFWKLLVAEYLLIPFFR